MLTANGFLADYGRYAVSISGMIQVTASSLSMIVTTTSVSSVRWH